MSYQFKIELGPNDELALVEYEVECIDASFSHEFGTEKVTEFDWDVIHVSVNNVPRPDLYDEAVEYVANNFESLREKFTYDNFED